MLESGNFIKIKCFGSPCQCYLLESFICQLDDDLQISRLKRILRIEKFNQDRFIECPLQDCNNAFFYSKETINQCKNIKCQICDREFCTECFMEWKNHSPDGICSFLSVEQDEWISINCRNCPQCNASVIKELGCDHVKCTNCTFEFCYICGDPVTKDHFKIKHWNTLEGSLLIQPIQVNLMNQPNSIQVGSRRIKPFPKLGFISTGFLIGKRIDISLIIDPVINNRKIVIIPKGITKVNIKRYLIHIRL